MSSKIFNKIVVTFVTPELHVCNCKEWVQIIHSPGNTSFPIFHHERPISILQVHPYVTRRTNAPTNGFLIRGLITPRALHIRLLYNNNSADYFTNFVRNSLYEKVVNPEVFRMIFSTKLFLILIRGRPHQGLQNRLKVNRLTKDFWLTE